MSSLVFVIELLKLSISRISLSRTPTIHMENSMLASILQESRIPSIGKDRWRVLSHLVAAMVHLAVAAMIHLAVVATSRMVRAAVAQAVGTGVTVGVVEKAATKMKVEVVRSQKKVITGAEQSERRWP
jgi:hypothetical protein